MAEDNQRVGVDDVAAELQFLEFDLAPRVLDGHGAVILAGRARRREDFCAERFFGVPAFRHVPDGVRAVGNEGLAARLAYLVRQDSDEEGMDGRVPEPLSEVHLDGDGLPLETLLELKAVDHAPELRGQRDLAGQTLHFGRGEIDLGHAAPFTREFRPEIRWRF